MFCGRKNTFSSRSHIQNCHQFYCTFGVADEMDNQPSDSQILESGDGEIIQDNNGDGCNQPDTKSEQRISLSEAEIPAEGVNSHDHCSTSNIKEETQSKPVLNLNPMDKGLDQNKPEGVNKDIVIDEAITTNNIYNAGANIPTAAPGFLPSRTSKIYSNPKRKFSENLKLFWKRYLGILYAISCSVCYSLSCLIVSQLITARGFGASYCFFWRFSGVLIPGIFVLMYHSSCKKIPVFSSIWPLKKQQNVKTFILLMFRVVTGIASVVLHYLSLQYIEIGDAATIVFSNPAVVMVIARFVLGERLSFVPMLLSVFTVIGVAVISKPTFLWDDVAIDYERILGVALATGSMVCNSLVFITLRSLKNVHFSVVGIIFGVAGIVWGAIETQITGEWRTLGEDDPLWDCFLLLSLATFSFAAQILLTLSLKHEEAGVVSAVRTFDVVFSFIWQCAMNHIPDCLSLIGAAIVISSVSLVLFRKYLLQIPDNRSIKKMFWFLLK